MLAHASLAMQTAFSCLLVCLLEFYYRRLAREAWLRWFAWTWVIQGFYVVVLWVVFDHPSAGASLGAPVALLGFLVPPSIALTALTVWRGERPSRAWIAGLFTLGVLAAAATFGATRAYPLDAPLASRIHNVPRHALYGLASLLAAVAFARHGRQRKLAGSIVTAGAWGFFGLMNLVRAEQWYGAPEWALRGAENRPDMIEFALITFVTNSLVWIVMSMGVGLLLIENAEKSERRAHDALRDLQAAQAERSRLARLVERSRDAILVVSARQVLYLNDAAARLLGFGPDQVPSLLMQPLEVICGIAAGDPMSLRLHDAIAATGVWEGQSEWSNRATGERIPVLVGAVAMETREGAPPSIGLIGRDLRERVRLEEELRQAQRQEALGRLAGGIAHDFNNLLTVIMGYSSLVLQEQLDPALRQNVAEILAAARRAAAITDRLRAFGRRQALHAAVFDLNALVESMRGSLEKLAEGDVKLDYELCPAPVRAYADEAQIEQVLMNLVLNARQAIDGTGRIVVRTARFDPLEPSTGDTSEFVKIEVEDTGSGIEPEVLEHIFDPYFTTRSAGTGLGLSMAYGIVRQSHGQMCVSSLPGRGTVFSVLLPASDAPDPDPPVAALPSGDAMLQGDEAVMVVDDRPEVTGFVAACLGRYGYRTMVYADSESALSGVRQGSPAPQLVIRDVMMPGIAPPEFAARLHQLLPGVPMIFMSGMPEASVAHLIQGAGGHFIAKPFTPVELAALVRRVLDAAAILSTAR